MKMRALLFISVIVFFMINVLLVSALETSGGNLTVVNSSRAPASDPTGVPAKAGNVTELNIFGFSSTQTWQGYFGNVTGTIQLSDSNSNVLYNWSLASPRGQIYASTNDSINWQYVQCFNYSAAGTFSDDTTNAGGTNQYGMNLTQLHDLFHIELRDVDSVEDTFNLLNLEGHAQFYSNSQEFSQGECQTSRTYTDIGSGEQGKFEEALLYEPTSKSVIFTSLLNEDVMGFDGRSHDFQMLVLEDGHGTDTDTTPYYFYVELN